MRSISLQRPTVQGNHLGFQVGQLVKDRWAVEYGGDDNLMAIIETALQISGLQGFTLFETKKGWQMATRRGTEAGWEVEFITPEKAEALFQLLGPTERPGVTVIHEPNGLLGDLGAAERAARRLTAVVLARVA